MSQENKNEVAKTELEKGYKYEVDGEPVNLTLNNVQSFIVGNDKGKITSQEFVLFASMCKARKLNPFTKEAYLIKYKDSEPAQMVVGKDAILKRAVLHPQYDGKESGIIVKNNETKEIQERKGCFYDCTSETLVGGWCRVYRKDWNHPEYMSVSLNEVGQKKNGELNYNWANKTATMVEKVAKVRALREAFVEMFGGLYIEDEFNDVKQEEPKEEKDPLDNVDVVDVVPEEAQVTDPSKIDINNL